jgi:hypothetical protein
VGTQRLARGRPMGGKRREIHCSGRCAGNLARRQCRGLGQTAMFPSATLFTVGSCHGSPSASSLVPAVRLVFGPGGGRDPPVDPIGSKLCSSIL